MIQFQQELFTTLGNVGLPPEFVSRLDRMFGRVFNRSPLIPLVVREFVDATSAAKSRYLPDGVINPDKDYQYIKTDASANAVTIYAFSGQTINGATTYVLAAQYDHVTLGWNAATRSWFVLAS